MFRKKAFFIQWILNGNKTFMISSMDLKIFYRFIMPEFKNSSLINALSIAVVVTIISIIFFFFAYLV